MKILTTCCVLTTFLVLLPCAPLPADVGASGLDSNKFLQLLIKIISKAELEDIQKGLEQWRDPNLTKELSKKFIDDKYLEKLYIRFKFIVIDPASARGSQKAIENLKRFGKTLHNMLYAMRDGELAKYGRMISMMRDIAYLETIHIPKAVKRDESRESYWHNIHDEWMNELDKAFESFLEAKSEADKK